MFIRNSYRQVPSGIFITGVVAILLLLSARAVGQSVDFLTGRLQYGIPLGELKANDISIPVRVSQWRDISIGRVHLQYNRQCHQGYEQGH